MHLICALTSTETLRLIKWLACRVRLYLMCPPASEDVNAVKKIHIKPSTAITHTCLVLTATLEIN
jgi:hypothetical protein